ncbi:MAG TPA: GNAT family N-acetyltransferase [Polyangiales bacterium]|nr:GNAT family N-acetyltransferase [Polyangiales bacterium]
MTAPLPYTLRLATSQEIATLPSLEMASAQRFQNSPHPACAEGQPISEGLHARWLSHDGVWVAESPRGEIVGFVDWIPMALDMYVVELDVHPDHAGKGLGRQLLDALAEFGSRLGFERMVLRTFRDVPWNEPYYRRLGFETLAREEEHSELANVRAQEASVGLDDSKRSTLYRALNARN